MDWKRGDRIQLVDSGLEGTIVKEVEGGSPEYMKHRALYKKRYGVYPEETGRIPGSWTAPFYLVRLQGDRVDLVSEDEISDGSED